METPEIEVEPRRIEPSQWGLVALIAVLFTGGMFYRLLRATHTMQSAALFIGLPAVLAVLLALSPQAKSATGGIVKGITLALLIVAPVMGEGYLCILVAAPLFYGVGVVVGMALDWRRGKRNSTLSAVAVLLLPFCLEGVVPGFHFSRTQVVEVSEVVSATAEDVESALAKRMDVNTPLPRALRAGFPRPLSATGEGLSVGSLRVTHFAGAEGDPPGDLVLRVAEHRKNFVRFEVMQDTSKLTQWIVWSSSEVTWNAVDAQHTRVVWRVYFDRELDPAWYFAPLERVVVKQAARYLIEANANPRGEGHV